MRASPRVGAFCGLVLVVGIGCGDSSGAAGGPGGSGAAGTSGSGGVGGAAASNASSGATSTTGSGGEAPGTTWFREPFETLGPDNLYGFANRYVQSPNTWETSHLPAGGWNGSAGAHVIIHPCEGCDTSSNQFNTGWQTPELASLGKPESVPGDGVYIRWRIRFDDEQRWTYETPNQAVAKFVLFGQTGTEPNSRVILHLFNPMQNGGCSLGFTYTDPPGSAEWVQPSEWGLPNDNWGEPGLLGHFGTFSAHVNIGWDCTQGVLVTHGDYATPLSPQHVGAAPIDGWYHLQFYLKSGLASDAEFRIWANNDDEANPSSQRTGFNLGVVGWGGMIDFVGYWGVATGNHNGFVVDDLEVGDSFHPNWYPDG